MKQNMMAERQQQRIGKAAFFAALLLTAFFCFWRLDANNILGFDEGRHAVNALEMLRSGEWIVSTYNGEADYFNLKPPLSMYLIMAGFQMFGINNLGIRFFSALCYLMTALSAAVFVGRRKGWGAGAFTMLLFGSSEQLLLESMARRGDANAVYNLWFMTTMLCLLRLAEKKMAEKNGSAWGECMGIGFGCSFAFLSKSYHAVVPVLIVGIVLIICLRLSRREWSTLVACALAPVLLWGMLRYRADGMQFLSEMLMTDVLQRSREVIAGTRGGALYYAKELLRENTTLAALILIGMMTVFLWYLKEDAADKNQGTEKTEEAGKTHQVTMLVLALWVVLPVILFSFPKTKIITYIYPSFTGIYVCGGMLFPRLLQKQKEMWMNAFRAVFVCFVMVIFLVSIRDITQEIFHEEPDAFEKLLAEQYKIFEGTGNIYTTKQNERMGEVWYQDELLTIEMYTKLHCADGSVEAYREDMGESYIIADLKWDAEKAATLQEGADGETIYRDEQFWIWKKGGYK